MRTCTRVNILIITLLGVLVGAVVSANNGFTLYPHHTKQEHMDNVFDIIYINIKIKQISINLSNVET
jgi:hypothetical protein